VSWDIAAALSGKYRQAAWPWADWVIDARLDRVVFIPTSTQVIPMTQPQHAVANPFALLMDPQAVFRAIENSERLERSAQSTQVIPMTQPRMPSTTPLPC
jgi:hypothetical protein